jgi:PAS domain S-box-containing protein
LGASELVVASELPFSVRMTDRDLFDFFERTADAVFTVSASGEICSWNASAERLFGFARVEAIGTTCSELFQGRDVLGALVSTDHCHLRDCASLGALMPDFDLEVTVRSGGRIWVNISTIVYEDSKTGRRRIVHLARSVDGRKRTEALVQGVLEISRQLVASSDESQRPAPVAPLSDQEVRILSAFSQGRRPGEIARELRITSQTLRNHLHHINQKLGTHTRMEAVLHAIRRNLISAPPAVATHPDADASSRAVRQMELHGDGQYERRWPAVQAQR